MSDIQTFIPLPAEVAACTLHPIENNVAPAVENYTFFICQKIFKSQGIVWTPSGNVSFSGLFENTFPRIYQDAHLIAQPLNLPEMWWQEDLGPLLALDSDGVPCALLPYSKNWSKGDVNGGYTIVRPDGATVNVLNEENAKQFVHIWRFIPQFLDTPLTLLSIIKLIHKGIQKDWLRWISLQIIITFLGLGVSYLSAAIFNTAVPLASLGILQQILLWLVLASILATTLEFTQMTAFLRISVKANSTLQSALWDRLVRLPLRFHRNYLVGDMVNRAFGFNSLQQLITSNLAQSCLSFIFSIFFLAVLFFMSKHIALWAFGVSLILALSIVMRMHRQLRFSRRIQDLEGQIVGVLFQSFKSMSKIKSANAEKMIFKRWAILFNEKMSLFYKTNIYLIIIQALERFLPPIAMGGVFAIVLYQQIEVGRFIFIFYIFNGFLSGFAELLTAVTSVFIFVPVYRRLKPLIKEQTSYSHTYQDLPILTGAVSVKNLSFRYAPQGLLVLDNVSLTIRPGQFIGIVGTSGSGKSTLLKLLMGIESLGVEKYQSGEIHFDHHPLNMQTLQPLRRQMGAVLQSSSLQSGSIIQNIGNFGPINEEEAWAALKWVHLDEEVMSWPMKLDTFVDEDGRSLSLGQRQRLLLAKALFKRPRLLIFDEATSALDEHTQSLIKKHLESLAVTRIFVAHRLSTLRQADHIYLLDQGQIAEQGTYAELKKQKGIFAQMAKRQEF
ncbi:MAG: ATP-binding cassette domain-containing protein [Alphaproteobacteria bacterium]